MKRNDIANRLRDTGERTLSNVGFSVVGESAVVFGALLVNAATAIEDSWKHWQECQDENSRLASGAAEVSAYAERHAALLRAAKCPECDGSGANTECCGRYELQPDERNMVCCGEPRAVQCQWCTERAALAKNPDPLYKGDDLDALADQAKDALDATPPIGVHPAGGRWMIVYEDQDVDPEHFSDERAAWRRLAQAQASWNCHLFARIATTARDTIVDRRTPRNMINRRAYEELIAGDLEWLLDQPRTLEREHIEVVLRNSADRLYGPPPAGSHSVVRDTPTWADGMERAAQLCDEEAGSARALLNGNPHIGNIAKDRLAAIRDHMWSMARTIRAFKAAGPEPADCHAACKSEDSNV